MEQCLFMNEYIETSKPYLKFKNLRTSESDNAIQWIDEIVSLIELCSKEIVSYLRDL